MEISPDTEEMLTSTLRQLRFKVPLVKGSLSPTPQQYVFLKWCMVMDPAEIDGDKEEGTTSTEIILDTLIDGAAKAEENHGGDDRLNADNVLQHEENMDQEATAPQHSSLPSMQHAQHQPQPQLLKGYEYTMFNPKPLNHSLPGENCMTPTQPSWLNALVDLNNILHPP